MEMFKQYLVSLEDLKYGLGTITAKMSSNATTTNKLLSESEIDQKIAIADTRHLYKTNSQGSFATKAELTAATTFYDASGVATTPTKNDIAYVLSDESHSNKTAKYVIESISGTTITWGFVIAFTDLQLTEAQLQAINSGITASKVTTYDNYVNQFLKLTGGTMSGVIKRNGYLAEGEETTSAVHLSGGKGGYMSGASIELYGKDNTAGAGKFVICASNGSIAPALQGLPNGQLTWNNMRVPTIVSTYINTTSDVNGNVNISSQRPSGTSIPIGFLGNSSVMGTETARYCFMTGGYYMSFSNSGATWEAWGNQPIAGTIYWLVL